MQTKLFLKIKMNLYFRFKKFFLFFLKKYNLLEIFRLYCVFFSTVDSWRRKKITQRLTNLFLCLYTLHICIMYMVYYILINTFYHPDNTHKHTPRKNIVILLYIYKYQFPIWVQLRKKKLIFLWLNQYIFMYICTLLNSRIDYV